MIVFIHGPDALLVRQHCQDILQRLDPDGSNTSRIDGRTATPQTISSMVATPAFLGQARVVVVDDLFARMSKESNDDEEAAAPIKPGPAALDVLGQVVEPNSLILVESSLSSVPAAIRKSGVPIEVRTGAAPRGNDLIVWVEREAARIGTSIDRAAIQALLDAMAPGMWRGAPNNRAYDVPPDLDAIQQELTKLATYAFPNPISREIVELMTRTGTADQLFPMLAALYGRDLGDALRKMADAIDRGDDHYRVIAQIFAQAELSPPIEAGRGKNPETIAKDLGLSSPARLAMIARSLHAHPVAPHLGSITAVDRGQKTGELKTSEDVLFALLATISTR